MSPQEIKSLFEKLKDATTEPARVVELCKKYFSENTPISELSIMSATIDPYNLMSSLKDRESGLPLIEEVRKELTDMLMERGYRTGVETHQEHILCGSSGAGLDYDANRNPYTVAGLLSGHIESVSAARKARELAKYNGSAIGKHWGIEGQHRILLGPIDDSGKTIGGPVLVDSKGKVLADRLVDSAPYKR